MCGGERDLIIGYCNDSVDVRVRSYAGHLCGAEECGSHIDEVTFNNADRGGGHLMTKSTGIG